MWKWILALVAAAVVLWLFMRKAAASTGATLNASGNYGWATFNHPQQFTVANNIAPTAMAPIRRPSTFTTAAAGACTAGVAAVGGGTAGAMPCAMLAPILAPTPSAAAENSTHLSVDVITGGAAELLPDSAKPWNWF